MSELHLEDVKVRMVARVDVPMVDLADLAFTISTQLLRDLIEQIEKSQPDPVTLWASDQVGAIDAVKMMELQKKESREKLARELQRILSPMFQKFTNDIAEKMLPE
jgi:hypothetical protein